MAGDNFIGGIDYLPVRSAALFILAKKEMYKCFGLKRCWTLVLDGFNEFDFFVCVPSCLETT
jgi:hypothetical protein